MLLWWLYDFGNEPFGFIRNPEPSLVITQSNPYYLLIKSNEMATTISYPDSDLTNVFLKKTLLICGIISPVLYALMNVFVAMLYSGYDSASQTVSELSAIGAPTRMLWVVLGVAYTLIVAAFGWGVWLSATGNRSLRIVGVLIIIYALVSIFWPFAPMHQREALAAGMKSMSDTWHLTLAGVTVFIMVAAMGFGAVSFGKGFRLYSIITILVLLVFGIFTALDAPKVEANLPTPWAGVWERINIGVFLLWVIVLAMASLNMKNVATPTKPHS